MASLIIGAGYLAYDRVKQAKEKKKSHNAERYAELEKENSARIANLQQNTCFCQRSDWSGGGCPQHGHQHSRNVENPPRYSSENNARRETNQGSSEVESRQQTGVQTEGWERAPPAMDDDEIEKINRERRKKGKGYKKLFKWRR